MNDFQRVLDTTERHLLTLRTAGVRFLSVQAETMSQLSGPPPVREIPTSLETPATVQIESPPESLSPPPSENLATDMAALRERAGACLKCPHLVKSRKNVVFGVGDIHAQLMFVGEAPGADEDEQGEPFVGRAGQLLNNMIKAMGLRREDVYIANIIKCRPPGNRTPERDECDTCSPFLMRQIAAIQPKVLVALGAVAAKTLLALNAPMAEMRGHWYNFRGTQLAVTYHPAFLLRDPRQKKEAWKDLQMVMAELGLKRPANVE